MIAEKTKTPISTSVGTKQRAPPLSKMLLCHMTATLIPGKVCSSDAHVVNKQADSSFFFLLLLEAFSLLKNIFIRSCVIHVCLLCLVCVCLRTPPPSGDFLAFFPKVKLASGANLLNKNYYCFTDWQI